MAQAVVVTIENGNETVETIEGDIERHPKPSGGWRSATPWGPQSAVNEHRVEEKYRLHVVNFYKDVIKSIGKPDQLLVMGPAQAKREFAEEIEKIGELRSIALKVETADKMTDPQIAAKVRATEF